MQRLSWSSSSGLALQRLFDVTRAALSQQAHQRGLAPHPDRVSGREAASLTRADWNMGDIATLTLTRLSL